MIMDLDLGINDIISSMKLGTNSNIETEFFFMNKGHVLNIKVVFILETVY